MRSSNLDHWILYICVDAYRRFHQLASFFDFYRRQCNGLTLALCIKSTCSSQMKPAFFFFSLSLTLHTKRVFPLLYWWFNNLQHWQHKAAFDASYAKHYSLSTSKLITSPNHKSSFLFMMASLDIVDFQEPIYTCLPGSVMKVPVFPPSNPSEQEDRLHIVWQFSWCRYASY